MARRRARRGPGRKPTGNEPGESSPTVTTAIHIPRETLALLRRAAVERANREGGRPSVSALVVDLVESQRDRLQEGNRQGIGLNQRRAPVERRMQISPDARRAPTISGRSKKSDYPFRRKLVSARGQMHSV